MKFEQQLNMVLEDLECEGWRNNLGKASRAGAMGLAMMGGGGAHAKPPPGYDTETGKTASTQSAQPGDCKNLTVDEFKAKVMELFTSGNAASPRQTYWRMFGAPDKQVDDNSSADSNNSYVNAGRSSNMHKWYWKVKDGIVYIRTVEVDNVNTPDQPLYFTQSFGNVKDEN